MDSERVKGMAHEIVGAIKIHVARAIDTRMALLESRIKSLESRPTLVYRGVWSEDESYQEGDFVTDHGSVWHCNAARTTERPGSSGAWQLAVKRGRDAPR